MDEPDIDPVLHRQALAGLARLNAVGRSAAILWNALRPLRSRDEPLRILDIACGGGDVAIRLAKLAARHKLPWTVLGVDKSETALSTAAAAARAANVSVMFQRCDVWEDELPGDCDVVVCSLFLHHLSNEQAVELLARGAQIARRRMLINDLNRSRWNYAVTWLGCRLLTRSPVVHKDGPISIQAAFTQTEVAELAKAAGLEGAHVSPRFPARWLLQWSPP